MPQREEVDRVVRAPSSREELLAQDKERLVERVQALQHELQQRLELEEEILHEKFQKGTASLQAQVEEALQRYRAALAELEGFRQEILGRESDPSRTRPYVYEDLAAPPASSEPDRLRSLVAVFRRIRSERERFREESERLQAELGPLRRELESERQKSACSFQDAASLPSAGRELQARADRLEQELAEARAEAEGARNERERLSKALSADHDRALADATELRGRLTGLERELDTARRVAAPPPLSSSGEEGYQLLHRFMGRLRLKELLGKHVPRPRVDGTRPPGVMLQEIIAATIAGGSVSPALPSELRRPAKSMALADLRQFMEQLPPTAVRGLTRVHDALREALSPLPRKGGSLLLDLDSLELVIGSRPRHAQCYYPWIAFAPDLQEFWNGRFRSSPTIDTADAVSFLSATLEKVPRAFPKKRLRFRLDARFFSEPAVRLFQAKRCLYLAAVPNAPEVRSAARSCSFTDLADGWEAGECAWKIHRLRPTQTRLAVVRFPVGRDPRPGGTPLFRDPHYLYHAFSVDSEIAPWDAFRSYQGRGAAQEREHALLRDFSSGRLLARGPRAHEVYFHAYLLASDLLRWFRGRERRGETASRSR